MLTFLLIAFGIVTIITKSSLFAPLRAVLEKHAKPISPLVTCTMCNGFWVGFGVALIGLGPHVSSVRWLDPIAAGWISSGVCWAAHVGIARLIPVE